MTPPLTAPFSTLASFQDLCDYLREEGVAHTPDDASQVTEIPTSSGLLMYLRWEKTLPLVQIVHLAAADIPAERLSEVEHGLALLNHVAPLAGFALDHERRFVYFRLTLLRDEQGRVTVPDLNRAMRAALSSVVDYLSLRQAPAADADSEGAVQTA